MASTPIKVNSQMQKLAENAVVIAKKKFGVRLDFSESSLQQLEMLLQQAHEQYKQILSNGNPNIRIENTVRVWGSHLGEVIRNNVGGDWILDHEIVFLQIGFQRLDPLGQVQSRIVIGSQYNVQDFFLGLKSRIQNEQMQGPEIISAQGRKTLALVECPDCGNMISPDAESCPYCGKPSSKLHCPNCKSTNVTRISIGDMVAHAMSNIIMAGPFARPAKRFRCNNCKYSW